MQTSDNAATIRHAVLTGAFGGVGAWLIRELRAQGLRVTCFDLPTDPSRKKARTLAKDHRFDVVWGDLTNEEDVRSLIGKARPDVVIHAAAIIPPLSFKRPDVANAVNVGGTRLLVEACAASDAKIRMVLVSSYSVHGVANPHRSLSHWTGDSPVNPMDDYARQKVEAEQIVRASGLTYVIVRLCAVFPIESGALDPDMLRFSFMLPYDRREHAIDVRDAALAIARAAYVDEAAGRTFDVGGGEGWSGIGGEMMNAVNRSMGLLPFPREAFRLPDADVDESWYYENWVDTAESEAILCYQKYSFSDFLDERRRRTGLVQRLLLSIFHRSIRRKLLDLSPYHGRPEIPDPRPFADAAKSLFR